MLLGFSITPNDSGPPNLYQVQVAGGFPLPTGYSFVIRATNNLGACPVPPFGGAMFNDPVSALVSTGQYIDMVNHGSGRCFAVNIQLTLEGEPIGSIFNAYIDKSGTGVDVI